MSPRKYCNSPSPFDPFIRYPFHIPHLEFLPLNLPGIPWAGQQGPIMSPKKTGVTAVTGYPFPLPLPGTPSPYLTWNIFPLPYLVPPPPSLPGTPSPSLTWYPLGRSG